MLIGLPVFFFSFHDFSFTDKGFIVRRVFFEDSINALRGIYALAFSDVGPDQANLGMYVIGVIFESFGIEHKRLINIAFL